MYRLLPFLCCLLPLSLSAQRQIGEAVLTAEMPLRLEKAVTETVFPDILDDDCADTVTVFLPGETDGFVLGSNGFFDLVHMQRLNYEAPGDSAYRITEAGFAFAVAEEGDSNTFVRAIIFADASPDGSPGEQLAVSDSIQVKDLVLPTSGDGIPFTAFSFPEPARLESSSFFVGLDMSGTYRGATDTSYLSVWHTRADCGDGQNVFTIFPVSADSLELISIAEAYQGLNIEMVASAVVTTEAEDPVSTRRPLADYAARLYPNPASTTTRLTIDAPTAGRYALSLTDATGRLVAQQVLTGSGRLQHDWPVAGLVPGLYLMHIDGPKGRQSQKLMVR